MIRPTVATCQAAGCPDLIEITINGRRRRVCGAAFNRIPGNLAECPTGWLDGGGFLAHAHLADYEQYLEGRGYTPGGIVGAVNQVKRLYEDFPIGLPRNRAEAVGQYDRARPARGAAARRTDRNLIRRYHEFLVSRLPEGSE